MVEKLVKRRGDVDNLLHAYDLLHGLRDVLAETRNSITYDDLWATFPWWPMKKKVKNKTAATLF